MSKPMTGRAGACDRISLREDNPMKNMAYTFAYQTLLRRHLSDIIFDEYAFGRILSKQLPVEQKDRLMMDLSTIAHNSGSGGLKTPLFSYLEYYRRQNFKIETKEDVDRFLLGLRPYMYMHPASANSSLRRREETSRYYEKIQNKLKTITQEPRSCLAI
jgi:hypothetical protein